MPTALVIEHFDVVEQLHFGVAAAVEAVGRLALDAREEALHHRVIVTIAPPAHAAGDAVCVQNGLIVLTGVRAALVGMMEEPHLRAPPLQCHVERLDGDVAIIDRTDGPAHDKPREQVEDDRQIEFAAPPDHELRRVADLPLIDGRRRELPGQEICRDRLIVFAHRRRLEPLADPRLQAVFLH